MNSDTSDDSSLDVDMDMDTDYDTDENTELNSAYGEPASSNSPVVSRHAVSHASPTSGRVVTTHQLTSSFAAPDGSTTTFFSSSSHGTPTFFRQQQHSSQHYDHSEFEDQDPELAHAIALSLQESQQNKQPTDLEEMAARRRMEREDAELAKALALSEMMSTPSQDEPAECTSNDADSEPGQDEPGKEIIDLRGESDELASEEVVTLIYPAELIR